MTEIRENRHIRSDEVQEIMSRIPHWLVRRGIGLIFVLLLLFLGMSWMIRYPDVINGKVVLTTHTPPIKLIVKTPGEISQLDLADNDLITKGQTIAAIHSSLTTDAFSQLEKEIQMIRKALNEDQLQEYVVPVSNNLFGELQPAYTAITNAVEAYQHFISKDALNFGILNTARQIRNELQLKNLETKQLTQAEQLLRHADQKFQADFTLFEKGIISQAEYFERERNHNLAIAEVNRLEQSKIQSSIAITNLQQRLFDLKTSYEIQKTELLHNIETQLSGIESTLASWQQSYLLISPVDGRLSYLGALSEHQYVEAGTSLFAILPTDDQFIAQVVIPKVGSGKVKTGLKVLLQLDNFPYAEYGQLEGKVVAVANMAGDDGYLVKVALTNGLQSTHHRLLKYTPEMTGTASIVTEDLRITDRIFNQFRSLFK